MAATAGRRELTCGPIPYHGTLYVVTAGDERDNFDRINFVCRWRGGWVATADGWRHDGTDRPRAQVMHGDIRSHLRRDIRDGTPFRIVEVIR